MIKNFKESYDSKIKQHLLKAFNFKNIHEIPKISKVVLNMSVGDVVQDSKVINNAINDMKSITGQKPFVTKAKKSVANFKLREEMKLGCKVTLRRERMYEFLERLVYIALPRVKDFKGFSEKSFDGRGSFNFGLKEQIVFPEINYDKIDKIRGMNITIVTTAKNDNVAKELLSQFNIPFIT